MARGIKHSYEFIKQQFEKEGYKLLSDKYINNKQLLDYICSKHHKHKINWNSWDHGSRCPCCAGQSKPTIKEIEKSFKDEGYELLTKYYKNNTQKLDYLCSNGHKHNISWKEWKRLGNRCPYCSRKIKKTIFEIKDLFEKENYILLTTDYNNAYTRLYYICPIGHKHSIRWHNWSSGHRCPYCAGQTKPKIDEIKVSFSNEGYELLSTTYQTNKTLLKYRCPKGHKHSISWLKWKQGRRCRKCSYISRGLLKSGPNSCWWKGGISCEPYCQDWTKEYKEYIKERDGYICLNPGCRSISRLVVHHIDYNKKDCSPQNLITVCNVCNLSANHNRGWYTFWYQAVLYNRYNYKY